VVTPVAAGEAPTPGRGAPRADGLELPPAVRDLAARLGREDGRLPAYVYDLDGLAAHLAAARGALPGRAELFYAVKGNPDPAVLRVVACWADGLEVASGGELAHAAAVIPGVRLAFGGPGKTPAEIAVAVRAGVFRFHVESPYELRHLGAAALAAGATADVLLRVNLPRDAPDSGLPADSGAGLVMGGGPTPFGMDPSLLGDCASWLADGSPESGALRLRGLHAHLASGLDAPAALEAAVRVLDFARGWCGRHSVRDPEINLGGGMTVDYRRPGEVRLDGLRARAGPGRGPRGEPADRAGPRPDRVLRLVRDAGARRQAEPRQDVRRGRGARITYGRP
jgi:diaminopimelate decarboxylase